MSLRFTAVCIDSADPGTIGRFWAEALGWRITHEEPDEVAIEPQEGTPEADIVPAILFLKVPEAKSVKNRLHIDLRPGDQDAEIRRLQGLGARRTDIGQGEQTWVVMADPEGNEFCVLRVLSPEEIAAGAT